MKKVYTASRKDLILYIKTEYPIYRDHNFSRASYKRLVEIKNFLDELAEKPDTLKKVKSRRK